MEKYSYLMHHGIKNQHWGVRNGPPYPLDQKKSNSIKKGNNEKVRYSNKEYRDMRSGKKKTTKKDKQGISHLSNKNERYWPELNNFGGFNETSSYQRDDWRINVSELIDSGQGDWVKRLDRPGHRATMNDVSDCNYMRNHNDGSWNNGRMDPGLNNNCAKCSATMMLRSLGYDVQASRAAHGCLNSAMEYWFDGAIPYKENSTINAVNRMTKFGNKGKGALGIRHADGSGHSVYFQNERGEDGKYRPIVYDGQIGTRYGTFDEFVQKEHVDVSRGFRITRLDNATPNWKHLNEDSVVRMSFKDHSRNLVKDTRDDRYFYADNIRYT